MGVGAEIKPIKGASLGSAEQVCAALKTHFPGIKFIRFASNRRNDTERKSFAKKLLPSWMHVKLVGPTSPFGYQGNLEGNGWAMQAYFNDAELVPDVQLSFYGKFDVAETGFNAMFKVNPWKLKVF